MKEVTVNENQTETRVGPGNHWVDVYEALETQGISVIGGRVSAIGVGGLTLGGGISFFSGRYGWACDNVNNYEVFHLTETSSSQVLNDIRWYLPTDRSTTSTWIRFPTSTLL